MAVVDKNNIEQEACILRFYKIVLSWDYLKLLQQSDKNKKTKKEATELGLKSVKDKYKDVDDYLSTFEPLLFEEVKAQITQRQDEEEEDMEWRTGLVVECNEVDGFHLPVVFGEDMQSISQNDLLLLSEKKFGEGKKLPTNYAFALVEHRQMDKIRLRMHLSGGLKRVTTDEGEPSQRLSNMCSIISNKNRTWSIMKICSLSTIAREYVALRSITYLPYKDLILKATDSNKNSEDRAWKISSALTEFIQSNHNESQQMAINAGLSRKTFVLIQGPPGTGKTQTILGLLSAILHATPARLLSKGKVSEIKRGPELALEDRFNHWEKASPWLTGINPLDANMPENGDDGFYPTSGNDLKPEVVKSSRKYRVRVLVCAPSNSALDEIVLRLMNTGIHDENDRVYHPNIVRIGLKAHHSVEAVSMDKLVEKRLSGMDFQTDKQKQGGAGRDRDTIRASIMDEAAIVFSTLSFSGSNLFSKLNRSFDVVVIDEAAQAVEPATLVPLATGCKQVFLVGDPVQLPATVISPVAEKFGYGMSLFKRFQKAGYPVQMLKTQYRMHPEIRSFPSREFYAEALEDGPDVKKQTQRLWHKFRCFGPFCFFDLHEGKESQASGGSWENVDEVEFVLLIYHHLVTNYPDLKSSSRLAIITPYRSQVKLFCDTFCTKFGVKPKEQKEQVDINTVDGFQGREKDVAIFSCVRSNEQGIGFVADFRRMNVGITRARSSVLVVGNALSLRKNKNWNNLIESAEKRNVLFKVSKPYDKFISDDHLKTMEVEDLVPKGQDEPTDDMDINVPIDVNNTADAVDHAPMDENDYGYGDAEGLDGGFDED